VTGATVPTPTPLAAVASGVRVAKGVMVAAGVLVGATKAVAVKSAENVPTAWVRISSGRTVIVGVSSGSDAPHALSNKAPTIKIWIPTINRNLSILSPFNKSGYFTWILIFVQSGFKED
jgi:hypothetical protein